MKIELFPCSGGMAEGFRRAGILFGMSFDWDADACASYASNLGHSPVRIDVRDLLRMAQDGWSPGAVDLLVADPPCTPWSRAGNRRGLEDDRDMLADTCELIDLLRPAVWVIGNVPGLDDAPNADAVTRTMGTLTKSWHVDFAKLDAADFGVPQHRVRPFWVGHRHGTPCIRWPDPTHGSAVGIKQLRIGLPPLRRWVTCRDALEDLPAEELGRPVRVRVRNDSEPSRVIKTNGGRLSGGGSVVAYKRSTKGPQGLRIGDAHKPAATITAQAPRVGSGEAHVLDWPWDRPATTVQADARIAPPGHHDESFGIMSSPNAIVLSERAALRLQGFPDGWTIAGKTKTSRWSQIGMAMPPGLAEAVARALLPMLTSRAVEAAE